MLIPHSLARVQVFSLTLITWAIKRKCTGSEVQKQLLFSCWEVVEKLGAKQRMTCMKFPFIFKGGFWQPFQRLA